MSLNNGSYLVKGFSLFEYIRKYKNTCKFKLLEIKIIRETKNFIIWKEDAGGLL